MALIAIDIDSTLYDFETPAREAFQILAEKNEDKSLFRGLYVPWTEWRSPADACGVLPWLTVIDMVHEPESILKQRPFAYSAETLEQLVENGHELIYVSSRSNTGDCFNATLEWLTQNFPDGELICSDHDKTEHLIDCQYIIDDRPKTLVSFVHNYEWRYEYSHTQRIGFGLMYEYNRALTDIPNIFLAPTWQGLNYYLHREGLIKEVAYAS